jgi:MoaA/NifB/PqqE/SkfB family radical SAM enzyme
VTYRCNATCSFCDIWEKPSPYISLPDVIINLKSLKELGVKVIDFTGGEPLLHRQIDQLLKAAKDMGFITTLTTNGLLYHKWAHKLSGLVDMLHFSLDSANKEIHDRHRGVACFDTVMSSIDLALSLGERPDILFTVTPQNLEEIQEVYDLVRSNGLMLLLNPVFDYGGLEVDEGFSRVQLNALKKWSRHPMVYLNDAFIQLRLDGGNHISDPVCKAASSTIVISPFNELVLPCYHLGKSSIPLNGDLVEKYTSREVQQLIAMEGRHEECEGCTINCYMQPSFAVEINKYFWKALPSTFKYNRIKKTYKQLF